MVKRDMTMDIQTWKVMLETLDFIPADRTWSWTESQSAGYPNVIQEQQMVMGENLYYCISGNKHPLTNYFRVPSGYEGFDP